jgi:6-pyruvoyltetrahydropterin/6-carboxytetrahydropterin synthase
VHGHGYVVELHLAAATLNEHGFVVDYGDLDEFKQWIAGHVDHRDLNDLVSQPTAEILASWFYDRAVTMVGEGRVVLERVVVRETANTTATYEPEP